MTISFTQHFRFGIPDFLSEPWHAEWEELVRAIDRVMYSAILASNITVWTNSTHYDPGNLVIDPVTGLIWTCIQTHNSPPTGTLVAFIALNPGFWIGFVPDLTTSISTIIVTVGGTVTVANDTQLIVINKAVASATPISLPSVALRNSIPLDIFDYTGLGGDITVTPFATESIMGSTIPFTILSGGAARTGGSIRLIPIAAINGWVAA